MVCQNSPQNSLAIYFFRNFSPFSLTSRLVATPNFHNENFKFAYNNQNFTTIVFPLFSAFLSQWALGGQNLPRLQRFSRFSVNTLQITRSAPTWSGKQEISRYHRIPVRSRHKHKPCTDTFLPYHCDTILSSQNTARPHRVTPDDSNTRG